MMFCFLLIEKIRRYDSKFISGSTYVAYFDSRSWHCLVDRAEKIPSGYRTGRCWKTGRTREQAE